MEFQSEATCQIGEAVVDIVKAITQRVEKSILGNASSTINVPVKMAPDTPESLGGMKRRLRTRF